MIRRCWPELSLAAAAGLAWLVTPIVVRDARAIPVVVLLGLSVALSRSTLALARWVAARGRALSLCWSAQFLLAYATVALSPFASRQLVDPWLGAPERWAGFDYHAALAWVTAHGGHALICGVYQSSDVLLDLLALSRPTTLRRVTRAFAACGLVGIGASLLFPALGAGPEQPWVPLLLAARAGVPLELAALPGVVSMPSFHAVGATLLLAVAWPTGWRWLAAAWWVALLCSAVLIGGHYGLDALAGVVLGWISCQTTAATARAAPRIPSQPRMPTRPACRTRS